MEMAPFFQETCMLEGNEHRATGRALVAGSVFAIPGQKITYEN